LLWLFVGPLVDLGLVELFTNYPLLNLSQLDVAVESSAADLVTAEFVVVVVAVFVLVDFAAVVAVAAAAVAVVAAAAVADLG
jgi:hypothetical protein